MASTKTKPSDNDVAPYERIAAREPDDERAIVADPPDEEIDTEPLSRFQLKERLLRDRRRKR